MRGSSASRTRVREAGAGPPLPWRAWRWRRSRACLAPKAAYTLAGYQLEGLRVRNSNCSISAAPWSCGRRNSLGPQKLEQFAKDRNLVLPEPGQVVHLEPKGEGAFAMVK